MAQATVEPKNSIPVLTSLNITNKNVQSAYQQSDTSYLNHRQSGDIPDPSESTIVLQFGSRYFKIGLSRDALPRTVAHVIAHRGANLIPEPVASAETTEEELQERLATRYRNAKKKPPPNIYSSIIAHNKSAVLQTIPALNDAYEFEWTRTNNSKFITGMAALRVNPAEGYVRRWPIRRGNFNKIQYGSTREVVDDLERIWSKAIVEDLKIPRKEFGKYGLILVVPDGIKSFEVKALIELILKEMGLKSVGFILESVAGTFGAGISSAVVVDIGAQTCNVSCIEDGQILGDSKSILSYGGDELTKLLLSVLRLHSFPYSECNFSKWLDFEMLDDLKVRMCTLEEDDISSQMYEIYVRKPESATKVYSFKVYEERIIVPSALFESKVPLLERFTDPVEGHPFYTGQNDEIYYTSAMNGGDLEENNAATQSEPASEIIVSEIGDTDMVVIDLQPATQLSLDEAIFKALDSFQESPDRLKKFLGSILVIGNGHKFPHFIAHLDTLLRDRYPGNGIEFVLGGAAGQPTKDSLVMDAGVVSWKGGAVMSKLDCMNDFWISRRDYDISSVKSIRDRLSFIPS